jgi:hypothetical protein
MEHTRFLLLTRSTCVEGCCSRIEKEARKIAECTSYTPCVLLSFSSEDRERSEKDRRVYLLQYTPCVLLSFSAGENGLHRVRAAAVPPGLNSSRACSDVSSSSSSRQQITNVEATSGHPAVLPLTWAPTARELLASRFIVPPPAPQHNPSTSPFSTGSYSSARFRAQHPKNLPETLAPTARDQSAYQRTTAFYHAARIKSPTGRKARFSDNISRMLSPPARAHCRRSTKQTRRACPATNSWYRRTLAPFRPSPNCT